MQNEPKPLNIPSPASFFAHSRTPSMEDLEPNACHEAWMAFCASDDRENAIDLSVSNATRVGLPSVIPPPESLQTAIEAAYTASPQGLLPARQAIARYYASFGASPDPDNIQLFASTSEAVGALIKLVCQPQDEIITFSPTYPLLDCLCSLESVVLREVFLQDCAGEWAIDFWALEQCVNAHTRAVIVVSPNNPTGHCMRIQEFEHLVDFCARRGLLLIVDEVFAGYRLDHDTELVRQPAAYYAQSGLVVSLSGLSKVCGLPQHKLGWGLFGGAPDIVREAMQRLSFITDSTLSVSGWVQRIAPSLLENHDTFSAPCIARLRENMRILREIAASHETVMWTIDRIHGGWSACIRLPAWAGADEDHACALAHRGVRVFPGSFFGYRPSNPTLVLSLIVPPDVFRKGAERLAAYLESELNG